jgi:hypothetical protein
LINRVVGVCWQTIEADVGTEAIQLDRVLCSIVVSFAQRLQFAQSEAVPIAAMWLDMISDRGDDGATFLQAKAAKWFDRELMLGAFAMTVELRPVACTTVLVFGTQGGRSFARRDSHHS